MAIGNCKNPDCPNHILRVQTRNGFCLECHAAIQEAKTKYLGKRREPFETIEEFPGKGPAQATPSAQDVTCYDAEAEMAAREAVSARAEMPERSYAEIREATEKAIEKAKKDDHFPQTGNMVPDPILPFTLAGIQFTPFLVDRSRPSGDPRVTIRQGCVAFSSCAVRTFSLHKHKGVIFYPAPGVLGIQFLPAPIQGSYSLVSQHKDSTDRVVNAITFLKSFPDLAGRKGVLEPTERDGFYLVRLGEGQGEAA
jgi:hypothetical protein